MAYIRANSLHVSCLYTCLWHRSVLRQQKTPIIQGINWGVSITRGLIQPWGRRGVCSVRRDSKGAESLTWIISLRLCVSRCGWNQRRWRSPFQMPPRPTLWCPTVAVPYPLARPGLKNTSPHFGGGLWGSLTIPQNPWLSRRQWHPRCSSRCARRAASGHRWRPRWSCHRGHRDGWPRRPLRSRSPPRWGRRARPTLTCGRWWRSLPPCSRKWLQTPPPAGGWRDHSPAGGEKCQKWVKNAQQPRKVTQHKSMISMLKAPWAMRPYIELKQ